MVGIEINTDRLLLRNFKHIDSEPMFKNWGTDENVAKYMLWNANKTIDDVSKVISFWINNSETIDTYIQLAIVDKTINEPIGSIQLDWNKKHHSAELGFCLGSNWWGQGIMSEVLNAIEHFSKTKLNINRLEAHVLVQNTACARMLEKSSYRKEGLCIQKYFTKRNQFEDCYIFGKIL